MLLIIIFTILGLVLSILWSYSDAADLEDYISNGVFFIFFSIILGFGFSAIVGDIGYNEKAQAAAWTKTYKLAENGNYNLKDGDINFVYIDEDGKYKEKTIEDNWNILPLEGGDPYVEVIYYETTNKGLQLCSLRGADKGKVYNLYMSDVNVSTIGKWSGD